VIGLLLPSLIGAIAALALRGQSRNSGGLRFEWWGLVVVAFGVELILFDPPVNSLPLAHTYGPWICMATRIALLVAVLRNVRSRTAPSLACVVMAVGIGLNAIVIVANGGYMPQSRAAAITVWGPERVAADLSSGRFENTRPIDADSRLTQLGDVLPQPRWLPLPNVVSIGDVVLALGMAGWIFASLGGLGATGDGSDARSVADVELGEDVLDVGFDGLHRNHQLVGDSLI
jgi:multidrug transporter EmrE-like cation transporter